MVHPEHVLLAMLGDQDPSVKAEVVHLLRDQRKHAPQPAARPWVPQARHQLQR